MTSNEKAPDISVSFVIGSNDLDPDQCSHVLGLEPTTVWRQKREHLRGIPQVPNVQWVLSTGKVRGYTIDEPLSLLLETLWPHKAAVLEFVSDARAECFVTCTVTITCDRPLYEISVANLLKLAELRAPFRMDLFDYSD